MIKSTRCLLPALAALFLAACGGSSNSAAPIPANLAEIDSTNAESIASAVLTAALEGGDLGAFASLPSAAGPTAVGKSEPVFSKIGQIQSEQTRVFLTQSQIGTFQAPIVPVETFCAEDGKVVMTGDIADPETLSVNDTISFEFVGCDDGVTVVDGLFSMRITAFSGDFVGESFSFGVHVDLTAFTVTENGESGTADGDMSIGITATSAGSLIMTVETSMLTVSDGTSTNSLSNYLLTQTIDGTTGAYALTVAGRIGSSAFEGVVDFTTTVDLQGMGEEVAFVGTLKITGASNATITVIVLNAQMIRLEVDLDGDGSIDETIDTTWAALS